MTLREHARLAPFKNDFLEAYRSLQSLQGLLYNELGVPRRLEDFCRERDGLFIVTGPTGSGKSTTLATMIDIINHSREGHIITIEDPIGNHKGQSVLTYLTTKERKVYQ